MNRILIYFFINLLFSCEAKESKMKDEGRNMNDPGVPIHVLIDSIQFHGNVDAFHRLTTASLDYRAGYFLSTFMIMADKFNNAEAAMEVYYQLVDMYHVPMINDIYILDSLNVDARKMVIRYLKKADSLGNKQASEHLQRYKRVGIIK